MVREALVVGINQYPLLIDESTRTPRHLRTAAADAEVIAQLLETFGDFKVRRLPITQDGRWQVDKNPQLDHLVKVANLENAITELFNPTERTIPDTALLFFAGHGLRKYGGGITEGFLATSDAYPQGGVWGLSFDWLRQLLQASPVRQQIVWLDCCYSGELLDFASADPKKLTRGWDRSFIAASRKFEEAYEDASSNHGILTNLLKQALNPKYQPNGWISNYGIADFINRQKKSFPQHPLFHNSGSEIILTGKRRK